ncbi:Outer membrane protein beta-barrel domain-containing protein [Marivirga sericea]|uniref:Outer membrane protein beta-barrel domain-containing protein n=1 Tax=Marivirga sericea TaxID=1028 RepID=A0A1X7I3Z2_9BACT|nr:porin family protein [Marivirga sericea]SMG08934.1 Outer membrane protein beta-barrel domain-containing protein [Marivirga sericea]
MRQIIIVLVFLIGFNAFGQIQTENEIYIKSGLSIANYTTEVAQGMFIGEKYGFHVGLGRKLLSYKSFSINGEILFNQKGWKFENIPLPQYGNVDFIFTLNYLDLALFLDYKFWGRFYAEAGGQLSYMLNYDINNSNQMITYSNPTELEFSPIIGLRFEWNKYLSNYFRFTYGTWSQQGLFAAKNMVIMSGVYVSLNELVTKLRD